ncbi:MAG: hypothetical protein IPO92_10450 [Saprospiraceae bacterium]|nr:hypothetical protein [Saprospiraceae bacterium]
MELNLRNRGSKNHVHLYGADGFSPAFQPNNSNVVYSTVNDGGLRVNAITGASLPFSMPDAGGAYFKTY